MQGRLIIAPPGSGKSTWIGHNKDKGWVEGDDIYPQKYLGKARSMEDLEDLEVINLKYKKLGYRIITGDWNVLEGVDAVVLPPLDILKERLVGEERDGHDPQRADALLREWINIRSIPDNEYGLRRIPIFSSIEEAVNHFSDDEIISALRFCNWNPKLAAEKLRFDPR